MYSNARDGDKSKETFHKLCEMWCNLLNFSYVCDIFQFSLASDWCEATGANETIINVCYCYSNGEIDVH